MTERIADLHLDRRIVKKLHDIGTIERLRRLSPVALKRDWRLTESQFGSVNTALLEAGLDPIEVPDFTPRAVGRPPGGCKESVAEDGSALVSSDDDGDGPLAKECGRPKLKGKQTCLWHWLLKQPIEVQVKAADQRLAVAQARDGHEHRARVPQAEWPEGERWCAECQGFIPLFYCRGSRCVAHASRAAHASMLKHVYDFTREDYDALLAWQRGRCYVCQQVPRVRRLAVDHDHRTSLVRGLLCANDEWGCNHTLARVLNDKLMAQRLLDYVTKSPLERMKTGEPPVTIGRARPQERPDDPFAGFLD